MNKAKEYPSYADYAAYQARFRIKPTISSYAYALEVEHCKRADRRLPAISAKNTEARPGSPSAETRVRHFEIQGESK